VIVQLCSGCYDVPQVYWFWLNWPLVEILEIVNRPVPVLLESHDLRLAVCEYYLRGECQRSRRQQGPPSGTHASAASVTDCGLSEALSAMLTAAFLIPQRKV